tara:strand:- start:5751 stop:7439 length:1689 start_codon:yes stop_codon:yes gene_type:complete
MIVKMAKKWLDIAVIGTHVRVPGACNNKEFFNNLKTGNVSVDSFSHSSLVNPDNWMGVKGLLDDYDCFDAKFFNISDNDASVMDPQHRVLLEAVWNALEVSGINPNQVHEIVSIFASCSANYKHWNALLNNNVNNDFNQSIAEYSQLLGNDKDFLATKIAHKLNFRGPAMTIQSGCSSSLVATHMACRALQNYESDLSIAAGVSIILPMQNGYQVIDGMIYSPTGVCKPYSEDADGTIDGAGVGVLVLKRLEDAVNAKDNIWGVIKGSAINNDGNSKVNFTAPSVDQQMAVMEKALEVSGIKSSDVSYIEGHGTGTVIGDAIELTALDEVYGVSGNNNCYIGSVKANIGHLDVASGIIGLAKVVLSLKNNMIFAQPNLHPVNTYIDSDTSKIRFSDKSILWGNEIKTAAISSLGIGGTNVHMILQNHSSMTDDIILPKTSFKKTRYISPAEISKLDNIDNDSVNDDDNDNINQSYGNLELEGHIISIWNKTLGTDNINITTDNFFALGGDSLSSIGLVQEINQKLNMNLSPIIMFDCPTLDSLCDYIISEHQKNTEISYAEL